MTPDLSAVDLFAGAGGLSTGLSAAGFRIAAALEWDTQAADTYALNHPHVELTVADARAVAGASLAPGRRRVDLVAGGPPCQGFSIKGQRRSDHSSNGLLVEFVRLVSEIKPRAVLLENVVGLTSMSGGLYFDRLVTALERIDLGVGRRYDVEYVILNAGEFETPQQRRRLFVVAMEPGREWFWPVPAGEPSDITLWDAIADLPEESVEPGVVTSYPPGVKPSAYARGLRQRQRRVLNHHTKRLEPLRQRRLRALAEGEDGRHLPADLRAGGHETKYRRLRANAPSPTVTAHMGKDLSDFIHPYLNRTLTVREAARLQGFPDAYEFMGSQASQLRQVGNAVPVPLAAALADRLAEVLRRPIRRSKSGRRPL